MESGKRKEDEVKHVHSYKPIVVNDFSCCVLTVDASWKDIMKLYDLRKIIRIQLTDVFNLSKPEPIDERGLRGYPRLQRMGSDKHYIFHDQLNKRDIDRNEEKLILVKDIITGGNGSEETPFQFMVELTEYIHFDVLADFLRPNTSIARRVQVTVAFDRKKMGTTTLHTLRSKLGDMGFQTRHHYFAKSGADIWTLAEEKTSNLLLSTVSKGGTGTEGSPFTISMLAYHYFNFEWINRNPHITCFARTASDWTYRTTLEGFRCDMRMTLDATGPLRPSFVTRFLFVNAITGTVIQREDERGTKLADIINTDGRTGTKTSRFVIHLKSLEEG